MNWLDSHRMTEYTLALGLALWSLIKFVPVLVVMLGADGNTAIALLESKVIWAIILLLVWYLIFSHNYDIDKLREQGGNKHE